MELSEGPDFSDNKSRRLKMRITLNLINRRFAVRAMLMSWVVVLIATGGLSRAAVLHPTELPGPIQEQLHVRLKRLKARIRDFYHRMAQEKIARRQEEKAAQQMRIERKKMRVQFVKAREEFVAQRKPEINIGHAQWLRMQKKQKLIYDEQREQYVESRELYRRYGRRMGHIPADIEYGINPNAEN